VPPPSARRGNLFLLNDVCVVVFVTLTKNALQKSRDVVPKSVTAGGKIEKPVGGVG
jgi:hypothetical protein